MVNLPVPSHPEAGSESTSNRSELDADHRLSAAAVLAGRRRVAILGTIALCVLVCVCVVLTAVVLRAQFVTSQVVFLAKAHKGVLDDLRRDVAAAQLAPARTQAAARVRERLRQGLMRRDLLAYEVAGLLTSALYQLYAFNAPSSRAALHLLTTRELALIDAAQRIVDYPQAHTPPAVNRWRREVRSRLGSGEGTELAGGILGRVLPDSHRGLWHASAAVVLINLFVLAGCWVIWRCIIARAFEAVSSAHTSLIHTNTTQRRRGAVLSTAFDALADPACMVDTEGQVTRRNRAFVTTFAQAETAAPGTGIHLTDALGTLRSPALDADLAEVRSGQALASLLTDRTYASSDGGSFRIRTSPAGSDQLVVVSDLSHPFAERDEVLRAEQRRQLSHVTSGVAHDVDHISANVLRCIELIRNNRADCEATEANLDAIREAGSRAQELASLLRSYAGIQDLQYQRFAADALAERLRTELDVPAPATLEVSSTTSAWLRVDAEFFVAAVGHLTENALDAMREHGTPEGSRWIEITLRDGSEQTEDGLRPTVDVSVRDNGGGFAPEALAHGFEPFYSTKDRRPFAGLGLSMVEGFVRQCAGSVDLLNREGGAQVRMRFAADLVPNVAELGADIPAPATGRTAGSFERCLLVEDNLGLSEVVEDFLERLGWRVVSTTTIAQAEAVLETDGGFDAALLDWSLPDGTSEALARQLHQREPNTKLSVMTGHGDDRAASLCQELGAAMLLKPVPLREVAEAIGAHAGPELPHPQDPTDS